MKNNITIILGNAPINNGNRGCVALSYTSIYLIDKVLSEAGIEYKLFLPDSGFREQGTYNISVNGKEVSYTSIRHALSDNGIKGTLKNYAHYRDYKTSRKIYKEADFILDIGQGDSFADIYGVNRFNGINLIHREAIKYHKPYCLLPQTIGPFKNEAIQDEAVKAITRADMVMARDKQSYDYTKEIAPDQKHLKEYIDVAFFLPYTKQQFDKNYIHVGLNISALLWHGGYTQDNQFGLKDDYQTCVCNIIAYFLKQPNVKLHLIPHVVGSERGVENDYAVSFDLQKEYNHPNLILAPLFLSPVDAKNYISGMDFFMGARMHSTIAAFSSGVPVVPMAYSRKFNGLFIDTLDYNHLVDLKKDDSKTILENISSSFGSRESLQKEIKQQNDTIVSERKNLLIQDLRIFFHADK